MGPDLFFVTWSGSDILNHPDTADLGLDELLLYLALKTDLEFKGTVQRDFRPPVFSSFQPAWDTDQWVKIVLFWFCFWLDIQIYSKFRTVSNGMRRVKWLSCILFKGTVKQDFFPVFFIIWVCLGHKVMGLNIFNFCQDFAELFDFFRLTRRSIILRWVTLYWVSILRGVKSYSFKCSLRSVKGKCHENKCGFLFYQWRGTFLIFAPYCSPRIKFFFDSAKDHTARSQYFV